MGNLVVLILIIVFYILYKLIENWEWITGRKERKRNQAKQLKERQHREEQDKRDREKREQERIVQQKRREKLNTLVLKIGEESGIIHLRRIVSGFDFKMRCDGLTPKQEELRNTAHQAVREMEQQETEPNYSIPSPLIPQQIPKPFDYQAPWWREYSTWYRNEKRWTCEECELDLNHNHYYLHTHHISGTQYNEPKDLQALCFGCHSETPGDRHSELMTDPDYKKFMDEYGTKRKETLNSFYSLSHQFEEKVLRVLLSRETEKTKSGQYAATFANNYKPIELHSDHANIYFYQGNAKVNVGLYKYAIVDFNVAIRLKPNYADAYYTRGLAKEKLRQTSEAKQDLQTALKLATHAGDVQLKKQIKILLRKLK